MRYTDEQKAIINTCRKYSKVHCSFDTYKGEPVARLYIEPNWDRDDFVPYSEVEAWLKKHSTLKSVGRPKGSIKANPNIKRTLSFLPKVDAKLTEIAKMTNSPRSQIVNELIWDYEEAYCSTCGNKDRYRIRIEETQSVICKYWFNENKILNGDNNK